MVQTNKKRRKKRRRRIRYDRILLTLAIIVGFVYLLCWACSERAADTEAPEVDVVYDGIVWSDTLTNAASKVPALARMDRDIERFRARWGLEGMSLAVMRNDSLLFAKGYGFADRDSAIAMDASTTMRIASASKLITAVAIMRLCDLDSISLDSKGFGPEGILNDPEITEAISDKRAFDITVDHLLLHTGGFRGGADPMFSTPDIIKQNHLAKEPTPDELTKIIMRRRLRAKPGESRRYSNFGYFLLSRIIEKVSGQSYWDFVRQNILEPIDAIKFKPAGNYRHERHADEATYYGPDTVKVEEYNGSERMVDRVYGGSDVNGLLGAGGWVTTASDLARVVAAIDGKPGVPDILSPKSIRLMTQRGSDKENLARGWAEIDKSGRWIRTGTLSSTHVLIMMYPQGDCWVMTTNSGVWTGHHFYSKQRDLANDLRSRYLRAMPRRNLW